MRLRALSVGGRRRRRLLGVAPAVVARTHGSGRPRAHRPTLLRGSADRSAGRGPDERRRKLPGSGEAEGIPVRSRKNGAEAKNRHRWSAERRAGRRHRPVIPGDPGIGPTARRATGAAAPAPPGALPPSIFGGHKTTAPPAPQRTGAAERWLGGDQDSGVSNQATARRVGIGCFADAHADPPRRVDGKKGDHDLPTPSRSAPARSRPRSCRS